MIFLFFAIIIFYIKITKKTPQREKLAEVSVWDDQGDKETFKVQKHAPTATATIKTSEIRRTYSMKVCPPSFLSSIPASFGLDAKPSFYWWGCP